MDDMLELLLTVLVEALSGMQFKNPRRRTWILTGFLSVLALLFVVFITWNAVRLFQQGSAIGTVTLGVLALAALVVCSIIIVRGHKTNW